ncbi:MAG: sodium:proton antiporter [Cyanobacteria bacterium M5B4]|nr:MAG: sodium:proton antiporter [Cyanobacteria bacterium M5B4]
MYFSDRGGIECGNDFPLGGLDQGNSLHSAFSNCGYSFKGAGCRLVAAFPRTCFANFLPPLLFESGWNLRWENFQRYFLPFGLYAVFGVLISIVGIGGALYGFDVLPLGVALLVAVALAATDPISVIALFKELGVGRQISTVLEGESLLNDGVAVVAFSLLLDLAMGVQSIADFSLSQAAIDFLRFTTIGVAVGCAMGFAISVITQRFDIPLIEQSLTLVSAYGSYLVAEELGGSGVISTVALALILGNYGSRIGMNPHTRSVVTEFWELLAFVITSIVFLLIGDQTNLGIFIDYFPPILIAIGALLLSRLIGVILLSNLSNLFQTEKITWQEMVVLWWGGLRGAVAIALALSFPTQLPDRELAAAIVYGVVIFTLLVQGLTVKPLINLLKLVGTSDPTTENNNIDEWIDFLKKEAQNRALDQQKYLEIIASLEEQRNRNYE